MEMGSLDQGNSVFIFVKPLIRWIYSSTQDLKKQWKCFFLLYLTQFFVVSFYLGTWFKNKGKNIFFFFVRESRIVYNTVLFLSPFKRIQLQLEGDLIVNSKYICQKASRSAIGKLLSGSNTSGLSSCLHCCGFVLFYGSVTPLSWPAVGVIDRFWTFRLSLVLFLVSCWESCPAPRMLPVQDRSCKHFGQ